MNFESSRFFIDGVSSKCHMLIHVHTNRTFVHPTGKNWPRYGCSTLRYYARLVVKQQMVYYQLYRTDYICNMRYFFVLEQYNDLVFINRQKEEGFGLGKHSPLGKSSKAREKIFFYTECHFLAVIMLLSSNVSFRFENFF